MMGVLDDDVAFERFVERHERALRHYAERMVGDKQQALKLTMEALQLLFNNQNDHRDKDLLTSCLGILRSLCERENPRLKPKRARAVAP